VTAATYGTFRQLDAMLARAGHHPCSPWWLAEAERFYSHPTARTWVARVGRGGAKSTTAVKVALNEVLFGDFPAIGPGERHYFAFVSVSRDEAAQRLRLIESCLRALAVPFTRSGETIDLDGAARGFKVFTASVGGVSGFRALGFAVDEAAKLRADDGAANPCREVVASLRAMTITHPHARALAFSSPLSTLDFHAELVAAGDTDRQIVSEAPSWVANAGAITEAQTRALEPDPKVWAREYAAIPQASLSAAFEPDVIDRAFREPPPDAERAAPVLVIDASDGRGDSFAACLVAWAAPPVASRWRIERTDSGAECFARDERGRLIEAPDWRERSRPVLVFSDLTEWGGDFWRRGVSLDSIVDDLARLCRARGARSAVGDQRSALALESAFRRHGIRFTSRAWTAQNKPTIVGDLRRHFAEGTIVLPTSTRLRAQLLAFSERVNANGFLTYGARTGHDDLAALLLSAILADSEGDLPWSPTKSTSRRVDFGDGDYSYS